MRPRANDGLVYLKCPNKTHRRYSKVAQQRTGDRWHCTSCCGDHVTGRRELTIPPPSPRVVVWKPNDNVGW